MAGSGRGTMTLAHELDRYLRVRRSLGYDLGTAERALRRLVQYADHQGGNNIPTVLFPGWHGPFAKATRATCVALFFLLVLFPKGLPGPSPTPARPPLLLSQVVTAPQ